MYEGEVYVYVCVFIYVFVYVYVLFVVYVYVYVFVLCFCLCFGLGALEVPGHGTLHAAPDSARLVRVRRGRLGPRLAPLLFAFPRMGCRCRPVVL